MSLTYIVHRKKNRGAPFLASCNHHIWQDEIGYEIEEIKGIKTIMSTVKNGKIICSKCYRSKYKNSSQEIKE